MAQGTTTSLGRNEVVIGLAGIAVGTMFGLMLGNFYGPAGQGNLTGGVDPAVRAFVDECYASGGTVSYYSDESSQDSDIGAPRGLGSSSGVDVNNLNCVFGDLDNFGADDNLDDLNYPQDNGYNENYFDENDYEENYYDKNTSSEQTQDTGANDANTGVGTGGGDQNTSGDSINNS